MSRFVAERAYDYFDLGDESDQERAESSEDEIDIILHGTPQQKRHLRHVHEKEQKRRLAARSRGASRSQPLEEPHLSSSEDEFEKEMNAELDKTVHMLEQSRGRKQHLALPSSTKAEPSTDTTSRNKALKTKNPFYDDIYFDSDDEDNYEGQGDVKVRRKHTQPSNDDLLYDPDMDEEDQKWVDERRRQQRGTSSDQPLAGSKGKSKHKPSAPSSDAVLDCPACLTTLCIDCQRHEVYPNQFRAMFVMNCKVNKAELLSVPEQESKKKLKKGKNSKASPAGESSRDQREDNPNKDQFHPVLCEECDTVVGVIDFDEVYHFFNVLPSQP